MNIELDPKDQCRIEALASESGKDPGEFLGELVRDVLAARTRSRDDHHDETELLSMQRKALRHLHACIDSLPIQPQADGLSRSSDHDAILYGRRS